MVVDKLTVILNVPIFSTFNSYQESELFWWSWVVLGGSGWTPGIEIVVHVRVRQNWLSSWPELSFFSAKTFGRSELSCGPQKWLSWAKLIWVAQPSGPNPGARNPALWVIVNILIRILFELLSFGLSNVAVFWITNWAISPRRVRPVKEISLFSEEWKTLNFYRHLSAYFSSFNYGRKSSNRSYLIKIPNTVCQFI